MDAAMKLAARVNGPPRLTGSGLILLCGYRGGNDNAEPKAYRIPLLWRVLNAVTLLHLRRFIAAMRDHFANPRSVDYQMAIADAIVERGAFSEVTIIADSRLASGEVAPMTPSGRDIEMCRLDCAYLEALAGYDTIVLVYPDALGLTWSKLERSAARKSINVIIANGRRQVFTWNRRIAKSLAVRRFLSNTRIMELLWGVLIIPISATLAVFDFARGRT